MQTERVAGISRRWGSAAWVAAVAGGLLISGVGCSEKRAQGAEATATSGEAAGGGGTSTGGSGASAARDRGEAGEGAARGGATSIEKVDLETLPAGTGNEAELTDAQKWVLENRPVGTVSEQLYAEIEGRVLDLMDRLLSGEDIQLNELLQFAGIEDQLRWAADANLDGELDEAELAAMHELQMRFNPMTHPYIQEKLDKNGDGEVGPEEMMAFGQMGQKLAMSVADRALLLEWDDDGDGRLSDAERAARLDGPNVAQFDMDGDGALNEQERFMAQMQAATPFFEALQDPGSDEMEMPEPPNVDIEWEQFDTDGDENLSSEELEAYQQAYQDATADWRANYERARMRRDVLLYDMNGDGVLDLDERMRGVEARQQQTQRQLFLMQYDGDGNGEVDASELGQFMAWHRDGAPRADADLNGSVDAADAQFVLNLVGRQ